ncbi:hypothetical protein AI2857V1_2200 [Serratia marcescens]|nr:hypothetical protein AI2857V1_2200 [Serratia marcescens]CAH5264985.1 hypothetical protein AI2857V1_2200 [Serratia marcescens]
MKCSVHIATGVTGFIAVTPSDNGFAQARYAVQRES